MPDAAARPKSCADWVESNSRITLTDFQRLAVEVLAEAINTGVYNLSINWKTVDWAAGHGVRFTMYSGGLSTYDFDHLTRLVFVAHERCVRVHVAPASRQYLYIFVTPRDREATNMASRHPTLEEAIETYRASSWARGSDV